MGISVSSFFSSRQPLKTRRFLDMPGSQSRDGREAPQRRRSFATRPTGDVISAIAWQNPKTPLARSSANPAVKEESRESMNAVSWGVVLLQYRAPSLLYYGGAQYVNNGNADREA
jgi:hypothetical protein